VVILADASALLAVVLNEPEKQSIIEATKGCGLALWIWG
jgi:PIN domain nuclease of toxin-antitoxin system